MMRCILAAMLIITGWEANAQSLTPEQLNALREQSPPLAHPYEFSTVERATIATAIAGLEERIAKLEADAHVSPESSMLPRLRDSERVARGEAPLGTKNLAQVGIALSWASADPKACVLLKRIEPSAVCVK
jgi:hypothetical protein